jgi:uncharacterized protein
MELGAHTLSRGLFDSMAAGLGGLALMRALAAAQYSKHLHLLRGVVTEAEAAGAEQARLARHGYEVLSAVQRADRQAVDIVLRYPAVGAWAARTLNGLRDGSPMPGAEPARLCAVAAAAAARAGIAVEVELKPAQGTIVLPSLGAAMVSASVATAFFSAGTAEIRSPGGRVEIPREPDRHARGWLPLRCIRAGMLGVTLEDVDPFRMPAVSGLAPRLSAREMSSWEASVQQGWHLIAAHHPSVAEEFRGAVTAIVPLRNPPRGQVSSSSRETFGAIALSKPPDPYTCAVTFAHEIQHVKLSALLDLCALTMPDDGRRYYAPWRPDPRPLTGLLQGTYAYLGVCAFWRRERELAVATARTRADAQYALWREGITGAIETLISSNRLTTAGVDFIEGMERTVSTWRNDPVPRAARDFASNEARRHMVRWERMNRSLSR